MHIKVEKPYLWAFIVAFGMTVAAIPAWAGPQEEFKETYNALAVSMGTSNPPVIPSGARTTVQINITRWSTDEERAELLTQLIENGQEAFNKALNKQKETGWIRATGPTARGMRSTFPSERLRYAREFKGEGGKRRLVLGLDRPISMAEAIDQPRWRDYDVTLIVLDLDAEGKGEGQLAMGVRLEVDREKKQLIIENFGTEPVRLMSVNRTN
jgi:hypothetical protein